MYCIKTKQSEKTICFQNSVKHTQLKDKQINETKKQKNKKEPNPPYIDKKKMYSFSLFLILTKKKLEA